jgi:hypothetical protein
VFALLDPRVKATVGAMFNVPSNSNLYIGAVNQNTKLNSNRYVSGVYTLKHFSLHAHSSRNDTVMSPAARDNLFMTFSMTQRMITGFCIANIVEGIPQSTNPGQVGQSTHDKIVISVYISE